MIKHWKRTLIISGIIIVGLYVGDWYFTRWAHYKLSYESLVREEIRHMVKTSCLQEF